MKNRAEWLTFGAFVIAVLVALGFLLRRGVHGQSAALAIALLLESLPGIFAGSGRSWSGSRSASCLPGMESTVRRLCATLGSRK
jgi:hypothetical protein